MHLLIGLLLSADPVYAALPRFESVLTKADPEAAVASVLPLLCEVLRQRPDGTVDRSTGLWLAPEEGLLVAPLDRVVNGAAVAVVDAQGNRGARVVAVDPILRLAVVRVPGGGPSEAPPRIVLRYPKAEESLPLVVVGQDAATVAVTASTEEHIGLDLPTLPPGAVLVDSKGGVMGMAVDRHLKRPEGIVPLVHAKPLLDRARAKGNWSRLEGPKEAQEACLALARQGSTSSRGCVDPRTADAIAEAAAKGAEAVLSAKSGEKVRLTRSGWGEQLRSVLEGRHPPQPAAWVAELTEDEAAPNDFFEPDVHELVYERSGMIVPEDRPLEGIQELLGAGGKVAEVVRVSDTDAWVKVVGRNLDGSAWAWSRHWVQFAGSWAMDLELDADELAGRPTHWPEPLDEGDWMRDLLMARMIDFWEAERAAEQAEEAARLAEEEAKRLAEEAAEAGESEGD